jgi:hypothetical protein
LFMCYLFKFFKNQILLFTLYDILYVLKNIYIYRYINVYIIAFLISTNQ